MWTTLLVVATSWPRPHVPDVPNGDKVVHALLYGVLAVAAWRAWFWPGVRAVTFSHALALVAAVSAFGWADEWHQQFIPGRSRRAADWQADSVGAFAGAALAAFARPLARRGSAAA